MVNHKLFMAKLLVVYYIIWVCHESSCQATWVIMRMAFFYGKLHFAHEPAFTLLHPFRFLWELQRCNSYIPWHDANRKNGYINGKKLFKAGAPKVASLTQQDVTTNHDLAVSLLSTWYSWQFLFISGTNVPFPYSCDDFWFDMWQLRSGAFPLSADVLLTWNALRFTSRFTIPISFDHH